ncbi:WD40 repeat-like protein [Paxillus ammoniavirescens]|nr:WD40 repeat-like protein [Paxillus ammoniavirescens]
MLLRLYDTIRRAYRRIRGLPQLPLLLLGHTGAIWSVAFLPDGQQVISGSVDRSVRGWRVKGGGEVGKVIWERDWVLAVAASGDGHWIATGGREKNITIWDAMTHEKVVQLEGHSDAIRSLAFSQDSGRLVSGSRDRTVIVWSRLGKRLAGPFTGHTHTVWEVGFSPSGNEIASCDGGAIHIWNSHSGELVRPINVAAVSCAWTPDGQLIAGFEDGSIKRFDSSSGSLLADWKAHIDVVSSIAVSPDGEFMASASHDRTVCLWNITTGGFTQIGSALNCDDKVHSVAVSLTGKHLMSGGGDGRVRIWKLKGMVPPSLLKNTHGVLRITAP